MPRSDQFKFYQSRSLGDKFNDASDFISMNRRVWFVTMLCVLLPVAILRAFETDAMLAGLIGSNRVNRDVDYLFSMVGWVFSFYIVNVLTWTMVRLYLTRPEGLNGLSWAEVWPEVRTMLWRMACVALVILAFTVPVLFLVLVFSLALPPLAFVLLLWLPWVVLIAPVYALEQVSLKEAISRAYKLGRVGWGSLVGLIIVMGLLMTWAGMAQILPMMLAYNFVSEYFSDAAMSSQLYHVFVSLLLYAIATMMVFGSQLLSAYGVLVTGMHYASVADDTYDASVAQDIENFEHL